MSTREELRAYAACQDELRQAIAAWGAAHPGIEVDLHFPADEEVVAMLAEFPEEWCGNQAARELVLYCIGRVPEATIGMFRTVCEQCARPH